MRWDSFRFIMQATMPSLIHPPRAVSVGDMSNYVDYTGSWPPGLPKHLQASEEGQADRNFSLRIRNAQADRGRLQDLSRTT